MAPEGVMDPSSKRSSHDRHCFKSVALFLDFEAHNLARFAITLRIGRHLWLSIPYDMNTPQKKILFMNKT
jgi:hypothetical protein